jgi:hypothetical protein
MGELVARVSKRTLKLLPRRHSCELFPDEQLSSSSLGVHEEGSSASVQTLVIESLNLLSDPFIQNRMQVRAVGDVYSREGL